MKKLIVIMAIFAAVYLAFVTVADARTDLSGAAYESSVDGETENGWMIGAYDGRVAVFRGGELYLRTDTRLSSLPKSDRSRIESGIGFDSYKELKPLLEDYCS